MKPTVETEPEVDGRWIAEVKELPGCLAYGETKEEAIENVKKLAQDVLADKAKHGEI